MRSRCDSSKCCSYMVGNGFAAKERLGDSSADDDMPKQSKTFSLNAEHNAADANDRRNDANGKNRKQDGAGE